MDNYYVAKLIPRIAEAQVNAIPHPLINITLQGRMDSYPKRRGMTCVPELLAAGVTVAFGQDFGLDPGKRASLVMLDATDPIFALRLRPARLLVVSGGQIVARAHPAKTELGVSF